jgi:hypothetical protein
VPVKKLSTAKQQLKRKEIACKLVALVTEPTPKKGSKKKAPQGAEEKALNAEEKALNAVHNLMRDGFEKRKSLLTLHGSSQVVNALMRKDKATDRHRSFLSSLQARQSSGGLDTAITDLKPFLRTGFVICPEQFDNLHEASTCSRYHLKYEKVALKKEAVAKPSLQPVLTPSITTGDLEAIVTTLVEKNVEAAVERVLPPLVKEAVAKAVKPAVDEVLAGGLVSAIQKQAEGLSAGPGVGGQQAE